MIRECITRKIIVDTVTNGFVLDAFINEIVRSGVDLICISINGHTAKEFHRMTGNDEGYFPRMLKNAEALVRARGNKKNKPRIEMDFIIDRLNYPYMKEMIKLGENIGADVVNLNAFVASPYPGFTPEERCLYADDSSIKEELALLMSKKYSCYVRWPYLLKHPKEKKTVCRWPFSILTVDGAGDVGGCPRAVLNSHKNGKIYDNNPWNNEYFKDLRRRHLQGNLLWPCESCVESSGIKPQQLIKKKYQHSS
jgi:MoaA/NifB/PqqE/SkfB family radical SAM enzyme